MKKQTTTTTCRHCGSHYDPGVTVGPRTPSEMMSELADDVGATKERKPVPESVALAAAEMEAARDRYDSISATFYKALIALRTTKNPSDRRELEALMGDANAEMEDRAVSLSAASVKYQEVMSRWTKQRFRDDLNIIDQTDGRLGRIDAAVTKQKSRS